MVWREERTCDGKARHTQELTLEQPTERALSAAAKLVGKTWYPDEPAKWDGLCEKIELAHHLEHATYVRAAMLGDRFAGIVAAGPAQSEAGTARADAGARDSPHAGACGARGRPLCLGDHAFGR